MANNSLTEPGASKCTEFLQKLCTLRSQINKSYYNTQKEIHRLNQPIYENNSIVHQLGYQLQTFDQMYVDLNKLLLRAEVNPVPNVPAHKLQFFQRRAKFLGKQWLKFLTTYQKHEEECTQYKEQRQIFDTTMRHIYNISKRTGKLDDLERLAEYFASVRAPKTPIFKAEELTQEWYASELLPKLMEMLNELKALFY